MIKTKIIDIFKKINSDLVELEDLELYSDNDIIEDKSITENILKDFLYKVYTNKLFNQKDKKDLLEKVIIDNYV